MHPNVKQMIELIDSIHEIEDDTGRIGDVEATLTAAFYIGIRLDRIAAALERIAKVQESLSQTAKR